MEAEAGSPRAEPRRDVSAWALAALLCAVASACPPAALAGLVLGGVALYDLSRRPGRGGRRLAVTAMVVSAVAAGGWTVLAGWWQVRVRAPMLHGPAEAVRAGQSGDVAAFQEAFVGGRRAGRGPEAAAYLSALTSRYGRLLDSAQRRDGAEAATDRWSPRIAYVLRFESQTLDAEARYVVREPGAGMVLKFAWLVVRDPGQGDLVFPAEAASQAQPREKPSGAG